MMNSQQKTVSDSMNEHKQILQAFKGLPKDLRKHIQGFHKSTRPDSHCYDCGKEIYQCNSVNRMYTSNSVLGLCHRCWDLQTSDEEDDTFQYYKWTPEGDSDTHPDDSGYDSNDLNFN